MVKTCPQKSGGGRPARGNGRGMACLARRRGREMGCRLALCSNAVMAIRAIACGIGMVKSCSRKDIGIFMATVASKVAVLTMQRIRWHALYGRAIASVVANRAGYRQAVMIHDGSKKTGTIAMACIAGLGGRDMILSLWGGRNQPTYAVTRGTILWRPLECPAHVACFTCHRKMHPL